MDSVFLRFRYLLITIIIIVIIIIIIIPIITIILIIINKKLYHSVKYCSQRETHSNKRKQTNTKYKTEKIYKI